MDDLPQRLRADRYAVIRLLGEGGQASTFEAVDKKRGTLVAIKRFRVRGAKSWKEVELAEREARVLSSIDHPALPRYIEHFEEGGELFLVTDKIEGESLAAIRKSGRTLSEREVVRFLRDAADALAYLHERPSPIVHRDIKPSNVIRRPDGSFALIDFGAVRHGMKPEGGSTVVGTFGYMAPEQFQGRAMPVSDVYAVGATALALLTGSEPEKLPHRGLAIDIHTVLRDARLDPDLVSLFRHMLDPDPDCRVAGYGPLLDAIEKRAANATASRGSHASRPSQASSSSERARGRASAKVPPWPHHASDDPRSARRHAREVRKQMKREMRAHHREGRRIERGHHHGGPPAIILSLLLLGLFVAQIAVLIALRMIVPTLFFVLSVVFGRGMRDAARTVARAGRHAGRALEHAKDFLRNGGAADDHERRLDPEDERDADLDAEARADAETREAAERRPTEAAASSASGRPIARVDFGSNPGARVRVAPSAESEADEEDDRADVSRGRGARRS